MLTAAKYLFIAFGLVIFIAAGVYVDCRFHGSSPEFCRLMVFSPLGARLEKAIPQFK